MTAACLDKTRWSYVAFCVKGRRAGQQPGHHNPNPTILSCLHLHCFSPGSAATSSNRCLIAAENVNLHCASSWDPSSRRSLQGASLGGSANADEFHCSRFIFNARAKSGLHNSSNYFVRRGEILMSDLFIPVIFFSFSSSGEGGWRTHIQTRVLKANTKRTSPRLGFDPASKWWLGCIFFSSFFSESVAWASSCSEAPSELLPLIGFGDKRFLPHCTDDSTPDLVRAL